MWMSPLVHCVLEGLLLGPPRAVLKRSVAEHLQRALFCSFAQSGLAGRRQLDGSAGIYTRQTRVEAVSGRNYPALTQRHETNKAPGTKSRLTLPHVAAPGRQPKQKADNQLLTERDTRKEH